MREVLIAGAAMTRFAPAPRATLGSLAREAAGAALRDASIAPGDVGQVVFGNAAAGVLSGQEMIRGQVALRGMGLPGAAVINVENACASSSTAFQIACTAVAAGAVEVALVVGAEQLSRAGKARLFSMFATATDLSARDDLRALVDAHVLGTGAAAPVPTVSPFMAHYAAMARRHLADGADPACLAAVAVKNRGHAALNPKAQFRTPVTAEEVLASRMIADPLRLLMCAPTGDGAAALVLVSADAARRLGAAGVRVAACALRSEPGCVRRAAHAAFESAGLGPEDLDLVELHDAASPAELVLYEHLGLCGRGEGAKLMAEGTTRLGGPLPVNTSGGLLSRGHPIGATGCAQLVELVDQLRGRCAARQVPGARVALAQNGGGIIDDEEAACTVTILTVT